MNSPEGKYEIEIWNHCPDQQYEKNESQKFLYKKVYFEKKNVRSENQGWNSGASWRYDKPKISPDNIYGYRIAALSQIHRRAA